MGPDQILISLSSQLWLSFDKERIHKVRMEEESNEDDSPLSREDFERTWKILKETKREKYKFLMDGGPDIKEVLFALFKRVWESEDIPELWQKTRIIQLYKGKSDIKI